MTQYLVLIHDNARRAPSAQAWEQFFDAARRSGMFAGGSAIGARELLGETQTAKCSEHLAGYMRFDADDRLPLLELLARHPVVIEGGTIELCELPIT